MVCSVVQLYRQRTALAVCAIVVTSERNSKIARFILGYERVSGATYNQMFFDRFNKRVATAM